MTNWQTDIPKWLSMRVVNWLADGVGAEKVLSTGQEQSWQSWTAEEGHHCLWKQKRKRDDEFV